MDHFHCAYNKKLQAKDCIEEDNCKRKIVNVPFTTTTNIEFNNLEHDQNILRIGSNAI